MSVAAVAAPVWSDSIDPTYLIGGTAELTLKRDADGKTHSYRIRKVVTAKGLYHFVDYLVEGGWQYLGIFNPGAKSESYTLVVTARAKFVADSVPVRAFRHFMVQLLYGCKLEGFQVGHAPTCSCCGRKLKTAKSLNAGIGPKCKIKVLAPVIADKF